MRTQTKHDKKGEELTYRELGQGRRSCLMALFPVPPMSSMPVTYGAVAAFLRRAWSTSHCLQAIELRPATVADLGYRPTHRQGEEAVVDAVAGRGGDDWWGEEPADDAVAGQEVRWQREKVETTPCELLKLCLVRWG